MPPATHPTHTRQDPAADPRSLSEQLAARAPHFKSFDHVRDGRARRAKEVEQFLIFVAEQLIPELAGDLRPLINDAHRRGEAGKQSTRDLVYEAMGKDLAPSTMEEFVEDLGLPYGTIYENLMKLAEVGLVVVTERERKGWEPKGKRGGARKPQLIFTRSDRN